MAMPRERDCGREHAASPAGDGRRDDGPVPRLAVSDAGEDRVADGPPVEPSPLRPVQSGRSAAEADQPAETPPGRESPLITAVEIENFKGIGRPVRIELRPITLLFGRNSAGKSTVLHALCYAHEILSHRNVDAHKTRLGGDQIDLGGFRQFVHRHDSTRPVRLRFELNLRDRMWPELGGMYEAMPIGWSPRKLFGPVSLSDAEAGWLELRVARKTELDEPIVSDYEVGVDGQTVGHIDASVSGGTAGLLVNMAHPLLEGHLGQHGNDMRLRDVGRVRETPGPERYGRGHCAMKALLERASALPSLEQHLRITGDGVLGDSLGEALGNLRFDISMLLAGIGRLVRDELAEFRYLGPLRDLHPGGGAEGRRLGSGRWADGSAAWDLLNGHARVNVDQDTRSLIDSSGPKVMSATAIRDVSDWLSREDRLDTGYRLQVQRAVHLPANAPLVAVLNKGVEGEEWGAPFLARLAGLSGAESADDLMREAPDKVRALLERIVTAPVHREIELVSTRADLAVRTSDIGVGISQLLPVVVAVLDPDRPGITAIEQPELHVHPRLQVELGDLFAEGAAGGNVFLIETHSEHLLLRIMRRMRQTCAGTLPEGAPGVRPEDVNVLFVEPDGAETLIREMPLNEKGELVKAWPGGFFEEDLREIF